MNPSIKFLADAIDPFEKYKIMAERSISQVSDDDLFRVLFEDENCVTKFKTWPSYKTLTFDVKYI
jgi:hypothetical protein